MFIVRCALLQFAHELFSSNMLAIETLNIADLTALPSMTKYGRRRAYFHSVPR